MTENIYIGTVYQVMCGPSMVFGDESGLFVNSDQPSREKILEDLRWIIPDRNNSTIISLYGCSEDQIVWHFDYYSNDDSNAEFKRKIYGIPEDKKELYEGSTAAAAFLKSTELADILNWSQIRSGLDKGK